ncbi:S-adenosyl-L-methionine-dependent methyltransferase [Serendipita vermifera]|nr:S-adenosyl-L-methionine-dependent methyltransferase [Serendipita vermifera]
MDDQDQQRGLKPPFEQQALNYAPSEFGSSIYKSTTSGNLSSRQEDDASSRVSVYTYYSTADRARLTRQVAGRTLNALSEIYLFPSDDDEWSRLDKQHVALAVAIGELYPNAEVVEALLAPDNGPPKKIADIGCGTGIWALEMSKRYPHCDIVGIDLAPVPVEVDKIPSNCHFEIDDVTLGLGHLHGQLDLAFVRAISMGIKEADKTFNDVALCLKPGGLVIWMEGDYDFYTDLPLRYKPFISDADPSGSCMVRVLYEMRRTATLNGSALQEMERLIDRGLWWQSDIIDPESCQTASLVMPIGPWLEGRDEEETQRLKWVGTLIRQDMISALCGGKPMLLKTGWPQETLDDWTGRLEEECKNGTYGLRVRLCWGRRRAGPNSPAPPLPVLSEAHLNSIRSSRPVFTYEVYNSQEEAFEKAALRNRGKDISPPPLPTNPQQN